MTTAQDVIYLRALRELYSSVEDNKEYLRGLPWEKMTEEDWPELLKAIEDEDTANDWLWDILGELRCSGTAQSWAGAPDHWSRHYESDLVVAQIDGHWVGWVYWYGGGKHGEPQPIDWIDDAKILTITGEREITTVVREFKAVANDQD